MYKKWNTPFLNTKAYKMYQKIIKKKFGNIATLLNKSKFLMYHNVIVPVISNLTTLSLHNSPINFPSPLSAMFFSRENLTRSLFTTRASVSRVSHKAHVLLPLFNAVGNVLSSDVIVFASNLAGGTLFLFLCLCSCADTVLFCDSAAGHFRPRPCTRIWRRSKKKQEASSSWRPIVRARYWGQSTGRA